MKTEIWCEKNILTDETQAWNETQAWKGSLSFIPRVGDQIVIYDGWASECVKGVTYVIYEDEPYVIIKISPDNTGEYRKKFHEMFGGDKLPSTIFRPEVPLVEWKIKCCACPTETIFSAPKSMHFKSVLWVFVKEHNWAVSFKNKKYFICCPACYPKVFDLSKGGSVGFVKSEYEHLFQESWSSSAPTELSSHTKGDNNVT